MIRVSTINSFSSDTTWTAPAGVTRVLLVPDGGSGGTVLTVVPNMTYSVIVQTLPATFGSLFTWKTNTSNGNFKLMWVE